MHAELGQSSLTQDIYKELNRVTFVFIVDGSLDAQKLGNAMAALDYFYFCISKIHCL